MVYRLPTCGYTLRMSKENDLEYMRRRLKETERQHQKIAKASGVPQATISRIYNGAIPRLDTAIKLIAYLKKTERKSAVTGCGARLRKGAHLAASAPISK